MLGDPAAVRCRIVRASAVAVVARDRPHRNPRHVRVALRVVFKRLRIAELEHLEGDVVDADLGRYADLGKAPDRAM